jgi:hypothetical protein
VPWFCSAEAGREDVIIGTMPRSNARVSPGHPDDMLRHNSSCAAAMSVERHLEEAVGAVASDQKYL